MGIGLPLSYREFLKYKHFYVLKIPDKAVHLPTHLPEPCPRCVILFLTITSLNYIGRRYINFADFHGYGQLCFDANERPRDNEYKVVYINYENLDDIHFYANNMRELLEADREKGDDFIDRLNEYYK